MWSSLLLPWLACSACYASAAINTTTQTRGQSRPTCRNVPGVPGFPTDAQWAALNTTVSGRLVKVVPFVEFCLTQHGGCTAQQSSSSVFRAQVPGAMNGVKLLPPPPVFWFLRRELMHVFFID